jgi:hypothetical protein
LSPTPSTSSATKTHEPHSAGPSAYLTECEKTPENTERDHDVPELADEGGIKVEYSFDYW